jgi:hypothetical protein
MDSLTHLVLSLSGGYILLKGLNGRVNIYALSLVAFASLFIDLDHIFNRFFSHMLYLHSVYVFILLLPPLLALLLSSRYGGMKRAGRTLFVYLLAFTVFLAGHMLFDMIDGQGIPVLYPFSKANYVLPQAGICLKGGHIPSLITGDSFTECIIAPMGIAFLAYYGLIFFIIALNRLVKKYILPDKSLG